MRKFNTWALVRCTLSAVPALVVSAANAPWQFRLIVYLVSFIALFYFAFSWGLETGADIVREVWGLGKGKR